MMLELEMPSDRDRAIPEPLAQWLQVWREAKRAFIESGAAMTPELARAGLDRITGQFVTAPVEIPLVRDAICPGADHPVPIRIYHPRPAVPLPVLLFFHGGGHMSGSVAAYDPIARRLARAADRVLVSVEYRRAPEDPYPAGLTDCRACARGLFDTLGALSIPHRPRLALAGDSAGGALAATLAHREPGLGIEGLVLIYPSLDYTLSLPSTTENAVGYFLETERVRWMFDAYFQAGEDRAAASPLLMPIGPDHPPTLIFAAGLDPLRDEAVAYAERLSRHRLPCCLRPFPGLIHAYLNLEDLIPSECQETYAAVGAFLAALGP